MLWCINNRICKFFKKNIPFLTANNFREEKDEDEKQVNKTFGSCQ